MNDLPHVAACPHRELAVGWALRALELAGGSLVAEHLPDCPRCTSTAAETEEVGATLGLSVPQAIPSTELERRVLSVTAAGGEAVVASALSTRPPPHITRRFWLRAGSWLRPQR